MIVGGSEDVDHEIYIADQEEPSCAENVDIPPIPAHLISAAGFYLESIGIVICGGRDLLGDEDSQKCFTLPNSKSEWIITYPGDFAWADMLKPYPHGNQDSYWIIPKGILNKSTFYKNQDDAVWKSGIYLPFQTQHQCLVTVNLPNTTQYLLLGGRYKEGGLFDDSKFQEHTYTYCKDKHEVLCPEGNGTDWIWTKIALTTELGEYPLPECSTFTHQELGKSVIVVGENKSSIFYMEKCFTTGKSCQWNQKDIPSSMSDISRSQIVNLNGYPVMFGGMNKERDVKKVWRFQRSSNAWEKIMDMKNPHAKHLVITVPESFFCNPTSTSSTTTAMTQSTISTMSTTIATASTVLITTTQSLPSITSTLSTTSTTSTMTTTSTTKSSALD